MLQLLAELAAGNTFVRNLARQSGFLPLLLAVVRSCAASLPVTTVREASRERTKEGSSTKAGLGRGGAARGWWEEVLRPPIGAATSNVA